MAVTAKSLILDLLSTLKGGAMPVRALVGAGALFALEENGIRVALTRLLASGLVERDERGQYRLAARAQALNRQVTSWRTLEERIRPWDGGWVAVLTAGLPRRPRRGVEQRARALRLIGFRSLAPGLEIRPDNLVGGVAAVRAQLYAVGLDRSAPVFALGQLDPERAARAAGLWDVAALRRAYRLACRRIARSERRLLGLPRPRAMNESFRLGGQVIRQLVLDPLLPEPMVPAAERLALVAAMRRYDRAGRACWADFLRDFAVLQQRAPADVRLAETPSELAGLGRGVAA